MPNAARGKELVERGELFPKSMVDNLDLIDYWKEQREVVAQRGQCSAACQCEQMENDRGELVCPHTWQPCKRLRLVEILNLFSKVNAR